MLAGLLPNRADYLPLLRLGPLPTAWFLDESLAQLSFQQVSPGDGGAAGGSGNQNYGFRADVGLSRALLVSLTYTYADDPLYAAIPSRPSQPANYWNAAGASLRGRLAGGPNWQLAAEGALELFTVGSGCGGSVSCDGPGTPNIFNDSGQLVFTRNWVGALSLPLTWQASRQLQLSLVPAVSFLPDSQGADQGGAGEFTAPPSAWASAPATASATRCSFSPRRCCPSARAITPSMAIWCTPACRSSAPAPTLR